MKILTTLAIIISFFSCAKKQIPYFLNFNNQSSSILDKQTDNSLIFAKNIIIENAAQNGDLVALPENNVFIFEDSPKESYNSVDVVKTTPKPLVEKKKVRKLGQIITLRKSISKKKPNYEKLGNSSSTMGFLSLLFFALVGAVGSFLKFSQFGILIFFGLAAIVFANIGLIFGLISAGKVNEKGSALVGITIGLVWDSILALLLF
jgi:hypothetical protein